MKHFQALTDKGLLEDIDATLGLIHGEGIADASVGVVGFCVGGRLTFLAGAERALGAAVSFYGGGIVPGRSEDMPSLLAARIQHKTTVVQPIMADEAQALGLLSNVPIFRTEAMDDIPAALQKMYSVGCRHLPVVDHGNLIGMISLRDLLQIDRQKSREKANFLRELVTHSPDYES